jgi:hypothetical protein
LFYYIAIHNWRAQIKEASTNNKMAINKEYGISVHTVLAALELDK